MLPTETTVYSQTQQHSERKTIMQKSESTAGKFTGAPGQCAIRRFGASPPRLSRRSDGREGEIQELGAAHGVGRAGRHPRASGPAAGWFLGGEPPVRRGGGGGQFNGTHFKSNIRGRMFNHCGE